MKNVICVLAILSTLSTVFCGDVAVDLKPEEMIILSDLPDMSLRVSADDCTGATNKPAPQKGSLTGGGTNTEQNIVFQIGNEPISMNVAYQIARSTITTRTNWETTSNPKARWMQTLLVPQSIAKDLTVEADGKIAFCDDAQADTTTQRQKLINVSKLTFRKTSTNAMLFEVSGTIPQASLECNPQMPDQPLQVRITPKTWQSGGNLLDMPVSELQFRFP